MTVITAAMDSEAIPMDNETPLCCAQEPTPQVEDDERWDGLS